MRTICAITLAAATGCLLITVPSSDWRGAQELHTCMEVVATLLAAFVGALALGRFHAQHDNAANNATYLFLGTGFLGTALLDGYHALVTSNLLSYLMPSPPESLVPWSWNASRTFLALLMCIMWLASRWEAKQSSERRLPSWGIYALVGSLTLALFCFFAFVPLPRAHYPGDFFGRPQELIAAILFGIALFGYCSNVRKVGPLENWLIASLMLGFVSQMGVMSRSTGLFDLPFDLAHSMKIASYLMVIVGLLIDVKRLFREEEAIKRDLLSINQFQQRLFACRTEQQVAQVATDTLEQEFDAYFARVWLRRPADICSVCQLRESCASREECLHLVASSGAYTHTDGGHRRVPLGAFKIGLIAQGRGKTICNDVARDDRIHNHRWAAEHHLRSFAGFPLVLKGETIGVIAMFSQKMLPRHVLHTLDILGKLTTAAINNVQQFNQLAAARRAAEDANASKSEFLANMSHEIRTPMTAILGFTETIADSVSEPHLVDAVTTVRRNGEHLLGIINDILDLSKIEAGETSLTLTRHDPRRIVEEVASLMQIKFQTAGLSFEVEYVGAIPATIETDGTRLRQILFNLIGNAVKFTDQGGIRLEVKLVETDSRSLLCFDVIDSGIGILESDVDKLFHPFTQADSSSTRAFGGTGLGLTISRRLANLLGGDITLAATQIGQGSTFRAMVQTGPLENVELVKQTETLADSQPDTPEAVAPTLFKSLHGRQILLVEDGPDNQRLITFLLQKMEAEVTLAENGQQAVELILAGDAKFDLVFMDMQMPVMDGYAATRELRREGCRLPIVALTAHAMEGDREACLAAGCDNFLTKPIDRESLYASAAAAIEQFERAVGEEPLVETNSIGL